MAILDFPLNPQNGDIYNANGRSWIYDSATGSWKSNNVLRTLGIVNGGTGLSSINAGDAFLSSNSSGTALTYRTFIAGTNMSISLGASSVTFSSTGSGGGGAGTVEQGNVNSIPYYPSAGALVTGSSNFTNIPGSGVSIINPSSNSISTTTGALVIYGGLGVTGNAFIGGTVTASTFTGSFIGNASSATYSNQSGYASTAGYATTSGLATSSNYSNAVNAVNTSADLDHPILFTKETSTTTTGAAVSFDSGVTFNPTGNLLKLGTGQLSASGITIGSANDTISTAANDLIITSATGNVKVDNNLTVSGNLTINGTTTSIGSTITTLLDPVFVLGAGNGGTNPTVDDNKDRGIEFRYFSGTAKTGFFGFDDSTGYFTFIPDATGYENEIYSGTFGTAQFSTVIANLTGTATTAQNLNTVSFTAVSPDQYLLVSSENGGSGVAVSSGSALSYSPSSYTLNISGLGISSNKISSTSTSLNLFNDNVTTIDIFKAGTAISVGSGIGTFTLNNSNVKIIQSTSSTSTSTGALIVNGGVGIGGSIYVSGSSQIDGITVSSGTVYGNLSGTATTAQNVHMNSTTENSQHKVIFSIDNNPAGNALSYNSTLVYNPGTDILTTSGMLITSTTKSTSSGTGALIVYGGIGVSDGLYTSPSFQSNISGLAVSNQVISTGTWAGSTISYDYGGTGYNSYTKGDLLVGDGAGDLQKFPVGSDNSVLVAKSVSSFGMSWLPILDPVYGAFASTTSQTVGSANGTTVISFDTIFGGNGITITPIGAGLASTTRIYFNETGIFNVQFSAQLNLATTNQPYQGDIWFRKNSSDIPTSNTRMNVPGKDLEAVMTVNIVESFISGNYIEIAMSGQVADFGIGAFPPVTTPYIAPAVPSIIVTVTPVSGTLPGSGIAISGIAELNNQTGASQTLVTGSSGSDFNISSSSNVHTFNLPDAGPSSRGVINFSSQTIAGAKTFSNDLVVSSGTSSIDSITGALVVTGGVGIGGSLYVSGTASSISGLIIDNSVIKSGTWAGSTITMSYGGTGYASNTKGDILVGTGESWYKLASSNVNSQVLTVNTGSEAGVVWASVPAAAAETVAVKSENGSGPFYLTFANATDSAGLGLSTDGSLSYDASTNTLTTGTFVGNLTGTATTSTNVNISSASTNIFHPVLFTPSQSSSGSAISSNGTLVYNPATDSLYSAGLFVTGSGNAVSFTQGALTVTGGIAASNIFINNRLTVAGVITSGGTATSRVESFYDGPTSFGIRLFEHTSTFARVELNNTSWAARIPALIIRPTSTGGTIAFAPTRSGGSNLGLWTMGSTGSAPLIRLAAESGSNFNNVIYIGDTSSSTAITSIILPTDQSGTDKSGNEFIIQTGSPTGTGLPGVLRIRSANLGSVSNSTVSTNIHDVLRINYIQNAISATSSTASLFVSGGLALTGNAFIGGTVVITNTTNSTSITSGALEVDGGVGVGQSVSVGGRIQLFNSSLYTAFVSAQSGISTVYTLPSTTPQSSSGTSVLSSTIDGSLSWVPMTATGGANIGYTVFNGNNFELAYYFQNGTGVTGAQYIHNVGTGMSLLYETDSSSTSTGALVVRGGVGITGNLYVGGTVTAPLFSGNLSATAATATDFYGNVTGTATSSRNVFAVDGSSDTRNHYLLLSPSQSGSGVAVSTDSILYIVPSTNTLFLSSGSLFAGTSISTPLVDSSDRITLQTSIGQTDAIRILAGNSGASGTFVAFDTFNKRVGLGISTPVYTLDVVGDINASSGQSFRIGGTVVLNSTTLGTGVTNSSLESLGTIRTGVWAATAITAHYGGTGLQTPFAIGDILFANTTTTLSRLAASTSGFVLASQGPNVAPQYVAQSTLSVGSATTANNTNLVSTSASGTHPITFTPSTTTVSGGAQSFNTNVFVTPSTGTITASAFSGPLTGNVTGTATTATNINSISTTTNTRDHYLLFSPTNGGSGVAVSSGTGLSFNPNTSLLGVQKLSVFDTTNSTSSTTGALVISGGVGVGGTVSVGSRVTVGSNVNSISTTSGALVVSGGLGLATNAFIGGTVTLSDTTNSTSSTTGALAISGGVGVGGTINIGQRLTVSSSLNSSSTTTGAIVNSGGLGMAGNAFIGGTVLITNTTNSTTINSGALEVDGGVGVGQSVSIGGRLQIFNGTNAGFAAFRYTGAGNTVYTLPNNAPVGTAASFLSSDVDGNLNWIAPPAAGSGNPGGSDTQIQFNDGGSFGGATGFTYDKITNLVSIGTSSVSTSVVERETVLRISPTNPAGSTFRTRYSGGLEIVSRAWNSSGSNTVFNQFKIDNEPTDSTYESRLRFRYQQDTGISNIFNYSTLEINSWYGVGIGATNSQFLNYFRTSSAQSANKTYILPTDYPASNGYVLSSTTTGTMSWVASGGGPSGTINSGTAGSIAVYTGSTDISAFKDLTITSGSGVSVNSNLNVRAGNQLRISNSGNNYTAIVANNTIGANFTLTLPSAAPSGTASSFLSADTSGNLFFIAPPSGGTSKQIHRIQLAAGYNPTLGADNAVFMIPFSYTDGTSSVTYNLRRVDCRVETTSSSGGAGSTSTFNIEKYAYNAGAGIYTFSITSTGSTTNIMTLPLPIGGAGVAETFWTSFNPGTVVSGDKLRLNFSSITALHTNFSISLIMEQN